MMKQLFIIISLTFIAGSITAQDMRKGFEHLYYERWASAATEFEAVLKADGDNSEALYGLVTALSHKDQLPAASAAIAAFPASAVEEPYYRAAKGRLLLLQNNKAEARNLFDAAIDQTKGKDETLIKAIADAEISASSGEPAYALSILERAQKKNKKDGELYILQGDAYLKSSDGSGAYQSYLRASENGAEARAFYKLGKIFQGQKNPDLYLEYFNKSIAADPSFAPAHYELYVHYFNSEPAKAMAHYKSYAVHADPSPEQAYDMADLLYTNKKYDEAIAAAKTLLNKEGDEAAARLYKMLAYSTAAKGDTASAVRHMKTYFSRQADSALIARDFISMGQFYSAVGESDSVIMNTMARAADLETDSAQLLVLYRDLAAMALKMKDFGAQEKWLGKYYGGSRDAKNTDLFNWGLAAYRSANYAKADSVFAIYATKYPEQSYGFYWRAKSLALQDREMTAGLAVPVYQQLIQVLQQTPTDPNYKKWLVEAYGYLAAYEANTQKDYAEAKTYFNQVLEIDPGNADAIKYIDILNKSMPTADEAVH